MGEYTEREAYADKKADKLEHSAQFWRSLNYSMVIAIVILWLIATVHHAALVQGPVHGRGGHHHSGRPHPGVT